MKTVYKKTVLERLLEAKYEAERNRKTIDYFLLTPREWDELRADTYIHGYMEFPRARWSPDASAISPVTSEAVYLKCKSGDPFRTRRFIYEDVKVLGERIVVAPQEFH